VRQGFRWTRVIAATAVVSGLFAGYGSNASFGSTPASAATAQGALGTPHPAKGQPLVFGLLNIESGPVTFPELRQAEQAAVNYVNHYRNGINGRPIKIVFCATDGQPSTSARCASQIADKHPVAMLGGADTGAPGSFPVYKRLGLAYLGGVPFTPVESNAANAVQFISISVGDNAAMSAYAARTLGIKKASVLYTSDTQGTFTGKGVIAKVLQSQGVSVNAVPVPPAAADVSTQAASAVGSSPQLVYVDAPNACPGLLRALRAVGYSGKIAGIDPCTSPPAIASAGSAGNGLYFAQPFRSLNGGSADAKLALAILQKYAPKRIALDTIALAGLTTVLNVQATMSKLPAGKLTTRAILAAFKTGANHRNFLAHPYTCNRKQLPGSAAICNAYQLIKQVNGGKIVTISKHWVTGATVYKP
jgi:branched-chain amino acid transport system substrate-binding protein